MKKFKDRSLNVKLFLPIILGSIFLVFVLLFTNRFYYMSANKHDTEKIIKSKVSDMHRHIAVLEEQALFSASICSNLDVVQNAYKNYYDTKNLDSSSFIIESQFAEIQNTIKNNSQIEARIHFHLPPARSFIRCWTSKRGDDISSFRNTVLQVSETKKPVTGIETGRAGFVLRGVAPIFSDSGSYYGSVEVFYGLDKVVKNITSNKDEDFAVFMNTSLLGIATKILNDSSTNPNYS